MSWRKATPTVEGIWLAAFMDIVLLGAPTRVVVRYFTKGAIVDGVPLVEQEKLAAPKYFVGWFGPIPDPSTVPVLPAVRSVP